MEGLDGLINRPLEGRINRGKRIQLTESEIRNLCVTAKQVFLSQHILLELEAPINICGMYCFPFTSPFSLPPYDMIRMNNLMSD